jgi:glycosyltransferase involved in cell wall biosynthesis
MIEMPITKDIVLLSTADWDNPFWTNKQHVACELARCGYRVLYVESLGLRRPSASAQDMGRIWRRLKSGLRPPRQMRDNLWVWSPLVIPLQKYAWVRALNRGLVQLGLSGWSKYLGLKPEWLWTYNPMTVRFVDLQRYARTIYHCVDEIKSQPGMPVAEIELAEHELLKQVDICFVTAEGLLAERKAVNPSTYYFSNVADFGHFAAARAEETVIPEDLMMLPGKKIGFIGAISSYKVDFPLLGTMATRHPEWSIVLIGKVGEGDPWTDSSMLEGVPNLHLLGPRDYQSLPAYLKGFDVAILPSTVNDYTRGMFPMKFFEYLAAGKPVVCTALDALKGHGDVACIAQDHEEFIAGVEGALAGKAPDLEARLNLAKEHTYERRTQRMLNMIEGMA